MSQQSIMSLEMINNLSQLNAEQWFSHCCAAPKWYVGMANARPFTDTNQVKQVAQDLWNQCSKNGNEQELLTAFEAHPMIGDVNSLRKKYAATKDIASNEQQGATQASEQILQSLADANHSYLAKHGFIFIICATGLSADTMLNALMQRLNNSTAHEIQLAAAEQIKITLLRLDKGLEKGIDK